MANRSETAGRKDTGLNPDHPGMAAELPKGDVMLALKLPRLSQFPWMNRKTLIVIVLVTGLPLLMLGMARFLATDLPREDVLEVARAVLVEHMNRNPPNKTWVMTATRISGDHKLEMDVDVANFDQAEVIMSRSGRVRHSYMKLACPDLEADVYRLLPAQETIWIRLHYNGKSIVRGACPLSNSMF